MAFFGLFGKKKKNDPIVKQIEYTGPRPYDASQLGLGADVLSPLSKAYAGQISERARGEGQIGFDPRRRDILRNEFLSDFGDYETDVMQKAQAQASGQGLRGGIPLDIQQDYAKSLARARQSGLAGIDVQDLQARREDINRATYAQPDLVRQGANIQSGAADFGLREFEGLNIPYQEPQSEFSQLLPILGQVGGYAAGSATGFPGGGPIMSQLGRALAQQFAKQRRTY